MSDDIDKAEALLAEADSPVHDDAASLSLAVQAVGQLMLYFAKEQRDATKKIEEMIARKADRKMAELDKWLELFRLADMSGDK
jgi:hypothetical protein